ncbi:MAG: D-alanyl-D-alanine carboxypeptidase [Alphaproteobacteria bacterium]|nr:MAG: D-alanyl-D-alanine carboxypeptidase [Alphaproteobacteria bacterium]
MKNRLSFAFIAFFFVFSTFTSPVLAITTEAKQAIIIDYNTGTVLFEKNADAQMPTSSMSKVITMYMVFEALKKGTLSLDDTMLVSEKAWKKKGSKMFVPVGKQVKVEDLIRGVIVQSGNDATIVLAEGLAGDEDSFAAALNRKAQNLGMMNSHFMNASGWPDPDHYSTARDLSILASAVIKNFPEYYRYYGEKEFTYSKIRQENRNPLLYRGIGADGLKTGHTDIGGYGLIGTGVKDNRRVIIVINGLESSKARANEATRLLAWGLNAFRVLSLFADKKDLERAPVYLGAKTTVGLQAKEPLSFVVPKLLENDLDVKIRYNAPLKAPIEKGQEVGMITISVPQGEVIEIPLVTTEAVDSLGTFAEIIAKARLLTTGQGRFD